ncbi:heparinase II/III family protein [Microlunatus sp. GCM10028923]|uniref:heparinase II/III domain-containing protein n=1 Tax=Microlunatus sp. GCM10028923 TaxID=3273400 RepID=UPI003607461E
MSRLRTDDELRLLSKRWTDPAFATARESLLAQAETALAADLRPVGEAGGWGHAFHCPDHVVPLEFDPAGPPQHRCPVDGKLWQGEDFDGGWRCALNGRIMGGIQACATVVAAVGPEAGARWLAYPREILLDYAERYPDLPPSGHWAGKGKITGQGLEEAVWAIGASRCYDAIRDQLSADERTMIENGLFRGLAAHVTDQLFHKIHNIECWQLSAIAHLGVILDDDDLIALAVDGETGLTTQFAEGILDDGWWAEGSPTYHYYMLSGALAAAAALRERRPAFLDTRGLRDMLLTPLSMIRSDFSLPATNDGWNSIAYPYGLAQYAGHYEQGYGLWPDPRFAEVLAAFYAQGTPRTGEAALALGPDLTGVTAPEGWPLRTVHPTSGYAILADDHRYLLLKYGPHGGGHGHPDKLALDLWADGVRLAPDAGSPAYTSPLQGPWIRQTLSHNTVLLDHTSQPEAEGTLINFRDPAEHPYGLAEASVAWPEDPDAIVGRQGSWLREPRRTHVPAYAGAELRRSVLWTADYLVDLVRVDAPQEVPIDLAWHHRGTLLEPVDLEPVGWQPPDETYAILDGVHRLTHQAQHWQASWEAEGVTTRLWAHDPDGTEVITATTPGNPPAEPQSTFLRRADGRAARFAAVIETSRGPGRIEAVEWEDRGETLIVSVRLPDRTESWALPTDGSPSPATS